MHPVKCASAALALAVLLAGCNDDSKQALNEVPVEPSATLVTVDKTPITRAQLELTIERTLGESAPLYANEEVERKILESLVSSRAMALLAERELDASEREQLDLKAQAYREELLVRNYLEKHANPEPVTNEQVADYYNRHQDEFGGGVEKSFEIIASDQDLEPAQRTELITLLSGPQVQGKDWQKLVADWRQGGKPAEPFKAGTARAAAAQPGGTHRRGQHCAAVCGWSVAAGAGHGRAKIASQTAGRSQWANS